MPVNFNGLQLGNITGGPQPFGLEDLNDVSISSPQTGQYLRYSGGLGEWQNSFINNDVFLSLTSSGGITLSYIANQTNIGLTLTSGDVVSGLGYTPLNIAGEGFPNGAMAGPLNMGGYPIDGLASPVDADDAATKAYVDSAATGLNVHAPVLAATTADLGGTVTYTGGTLDANGGHGIGAYLTGPMAVLVIDTYTVNLGDRVLVKNQTTAPGAIANGVYTLTTVGTISTPWVLTRATDYNDSVADQVIPGDYLFVEPFLGSTNGGSSWVQTGVGSFAHGATDIGVDNITFTQFSAATAYSAGSGLTLSGNIFSLTTPVLVSSGGTGQTTVTAAFGALSPLTTQGDLLYYNATQNTRLPAGTAGYLLQTQGAGANPVWVAPSTLTVGSTTTAGNILGGATGSLSYQSGLNTTVFLGIGTAGQVLTVNPGGTAPQWSSQSSLSAGSAISVSGGAAWEVLYQSAPGTTAFTTAGLTGQVLTATTGGAPTWATLSGVSVTSITGTSNEIAASSSTGSVTLSIPSTFIAPGSLSYTTQIDLTTENLVAAGTSQGTATSIVNTFSNIISTPVNSGVILPTPGSDGELHKITNNGLNTLAVYPQSGGNLDYGTVNAPAMLPTLLSVEYMWKASASTWISTVDFVTTDSTISVTHTTGGGITLSLASPVPISLGGTGQSTQTAAFDALAPTTTAGDIIYYNGTHNVNLPIGTTGQTLTVVGGEPAWENTSSGTVTNVSVATANGFAGTVATSTTTPIITLETTVTGILYGNGTSVAAATVSNINSVGQLNQNTTGNAATATSATNLSGGAAGEIPWQSAASTTGFTAAGTSGQVLLSAGASSPTWTSQSALSVGSATSATTATNIAGGASNNLVYQTASSTTGFITPTTNGFVLTLVAGVPTWATAGASSSANTVATVNNTSSASTWYPTFVSANSGNNAITVDSSVLTFVPSTGALSATTFIGALSGNATTATSATTATNVAGGSAGEVLYQSAASTTAFTAVGTSGQVLTSNGAATPSWTSQSSLSVGIATNIASGTLNQIPYQTAANTTSFITAASSGFLQYNGSAFVWSTPSSATTISNISTNATYYPTFTSATSGTISTLDVSSTGLSFNPSTGTLTATAFSGNSTTATTATNLAGGSNGTIPYQSAAGTTQMLGAGATNTILQSNGAAAPSWVAQSTLSVGSATTATNVAGGSAGEVHYQSAASTTAFTAVGSSGQVLTSNGAAAPTWTTPSSAFNGGTITNGITIATNTSPQFILGVSNTPLPASAQIIGAAGGTTGYSGVPLILQGGGSDPAGTCNGGNISVIGGAQNANGGNSAGNVYITGGNGNAGGVGNGGAIIISTGASFYSVPTITFLTGTSPATVVTIGGSAASTTTSTGTLVVNSGGLGVAGQVTANILASTVATGTAPLTVSSTTQVANLNAATAGTATNVAGGAAGEVHYQSAASTTGFTAAGTSGQVLTSAGTSAPTWTSQSGLSVGTATNLAGGAAGEIPYQTGAGATSFSAAGTSGQALLSGGTGAPTWGTLTAADGGTGQTTYTVGDILYASAATTLSKLSDVAAGSYLRSGGTSTAPVWSTLVLPNAATTGDILYASGTNTIGNLADVATGSILISGGIGVAPSWSTTPTFAGTNISGTGASFTAGNSSNTLITTTGANTAYPIALSPTSSTGQQSLLMDTNVTINASTGVLTAGSFVPSSSTVPTNGMYLSAANTLNFASNTTKGLTLASAGSLVQGSGSALSTSATDGFLYVAGGAGVPTGTPTSFTGSTPLYFDQTNNTIYYYTNSSWWNISTIQQNSESAAYTLVASDAGKHILHPSADTTARTFTIPANSSVAYPIGTAITFVNAQGAGVVTIAINTDTMYFAGNANTTGSRTLTAVGVATALKIASTVWVISGTGLT